MIIPQFVAENIQAMMAVADVCPTEFVENSLYKRDISQTWDDTKNGWNKCMDKKWCKIVVIVCIIIGGLFVFWLLSTIFQLICCGVKCIDAMCCCCCRGRRKKTEVIYKEQPAPTSQGNAYTNPNMYYQQNSNPFADRNRYQQQHY
ncbi:hypothetical protein KL942_001681 [Ogataea angusta]|uniref:Uncharacterized protein n=1 Tax=Pichia angusta TaxID=870730 RepID=A0ABQ7RZT2_PICAN|nr:hypothetical protein KL942_001681 [Ogataea angusta]KAG7850620.1 hypothetical protein KL940_001197 [Ogataea angusta]